MRPLTHWRIRAAHLPERLTEGAPFDTSFRLPGADALSAFADLLGEPENDADDNAPDGEEADFTLPAAIPDDISGAVELAVELDFGALCADDAELTLELVRGKGRVLADDTALCTFQNPKDGFLRVPLTRALHAGRRQTLRLCFDASRPASVLGPVNLHLTTCARLRDVALLPDAAAKTVRLRATLAAMETGRYVLRARAACKDDALPVHDLPVSLTAGEPQEVQMTLPLPGNPFVPGQAADGPSVRIQLFAQGRHGALCDELTLLCGYSGQPAAYDVPLLPLECLDPDALLSRIGRMRLFGVWLDAPAPDCFYRAMTLAGVSVLHPFATEAMRERLARHACVCFGDAPLPRMRNLPALDAWLLCGLTACPRTPPASCSSTNAQTAALNADPANHAPHRGRALTCVGASAVCKAAKTSSSRQTPGGQSAPEKRFCRAASASRRTRTARSHSSTAAMFGLCASSSHPAASKSSSAGVASAGGVRGQAVRPQSSHASSAGRLRMRGRGASPKHTHA